MKNAIKDYSIYVEGYKHVDEKASIYTAVMSVGIILCTMQSFCIPWCL